MACSRRKEHRLPWWRCSSDPDTSMDLRDRLLQLNIADAPVKSPKEFSKTIEDDLAVWSQIARSSSIKLDQQAPPGKPGMGDTALPWIGRRL